MMIDGKEVNYTATAGHLIAKLPEGTPNADQAAVFYMAYTRDDLPRKDRPVTFFWNGGPGSSSIFLHMGSWAPKRVKTGMPIMPAEAKVKKPDNFPLIDNEEVLLDHSDLVFVDPVGTGLSQAIKPHKNIDFWGMDEDAALLRDFITRYINVNQRQSSPKYLYGESYGGIRTPVVAKLMLKAGTSSYAPDPSGEKAIAYSGMVLNSPILDYNSNCEMNRFLSCAGFMPSYGMTADYYKKGTLRGGASVAEFVETMRAFTRDKYLPAHQAKYTQAYSFVKAAYIEAKHQYAHFLKYNRTELDWQFRAGWSATANTLSYGTKLADLILKTPNLIGVGAVDAERKAFVDKFMINPYQTMKLVTEHLEAGTKVPSGAWAAFISTLEGSQFLADMTSITGINLDWAREFDINVYDFKEKLLPGESMNPYDARLSIPKGAYDITFYEDESFQKSLNTVLTDVFDFQSNTPYKPNNFDEIGKVWKYRDSSSVYAKSSLPDIVETLGYAPSAKILVLHGYYDLVTPFHQTELDLINMKLDNRIPVKNYEGGHMTYESEEARAPMKQELDKFYTTPLSSAIMTQ
ncbi:hypothetical protein [Phyllobacterium sp. SB3]|uniref:S10 family serine carboxypeptidase-like protein n=1 Tax=Phyllobacterium sp. SB3 TaxID=3156073 RepID=UPI0032AFF9BD